MFRTRAIRFGLLMIAIAFVAACAGGQTVGKQAKWNTKGLKSSKLPKFDIPVVVNDRVVAWIDYFQGPGRRHFERYLARSGRYIPQMQDILKKYGLPQDLVYLAMIESGFSAKAYSRAHASGHWQFIRATGKRYGLDQNNWIDKRRDWEASTDAAARYLKDLYAMFGDWHLAMAAYNAGEGKISKAIAKNNTRDFWVMIERDKRYLKAETKDYVPKFLAAAIISKSPERFGFDNIVYDKEFEYEHAKIDTQTDLQVVAKCAGVDPQAVEELNPELLKGVTPPSSDYHIRLPRGTAEKFKDTYAKLPDSEKIMLVRHTVRKGESIGRIAKRYGVSVREIVAANDLGNVKNVKRGMTLIIPTGGEARNVIDTNVALETSRPTGKALKHRVQRGETLGVIAQNYGVGVADLKRWNKLGGKHMIRVGQMLKVYGVEDSGAKVAFKGETKKSGSGKTYVVRRGDSWWKVAQKNGVSIGDLKTWNPNMAELKVGQKIKLYASEEKNVFKPIDSSVGSLDTGTTSVTNMSQPTSSLSASELLEPKMSVVSSTPTQVKQQSPVTPTPKNPKNIKYQVKNGDTLWDIANKYGVSVDNIKNWNNIGVGAHKNIKPGEYLTLNVD